MTTLAFDTETNGFLDKLTTIHSLVVKNVDTGERSSCAITGNGDTPDGYRPMKEGLDHLAEADIIIGHNSIKFDMPVLHKIYPAWETRAQVRDTLLMCRLIWPEIRKTDFSASFLRKRPNFPGRLSGRHSLEAWGHRLGLHKGDYDGGWDTWSVAMQDYCELDVDVLVRLYHRCMKANYSEQAIDIEHRFAHWIFKQEQRGIAFDVGAAAKLYSELSADRQGIVESLSDVFPDWWAGIETTPRSDRAMKRPDLGIVTIPRFSKKGKPLKPYVGPVKEEYTAGAPYSKLTRKSFNPASRDHIAERLIAIRGWKPNEFTPDGHVKVDETILSELPWPEAAVLNEYLLIDKRIGMLAEGKQAWLKKEKSGRIHGTVMTIGAVTRRCTHSNPNVAQVPKVGSRYGKECRSLFTASLMGTTCLVGADASGLELRCLAHYMSKWDGGAYIKAVCEGRESDGTDVHSVNCRALGLEPRKVYTVFGKTIKGRDIAKTFIYALLYGAGDAKLGSIVGKGASEGKKLKRRFFKNLPALGHLMTAIKETLKKRKYLTAIDGGRLTIRHKHAALNTLLQSAGSILVKLGTALACEDLSTQGYVWGTDWAMVAHVHDELQIETQEGLGDIVGQTVVRGFERAGEQLGFRCPTTGAYKVGKNWAETH